MSEWSFDETTTLHSNIKYLILFYFRYEFLGFSESDRQRKKGEKTLETSGFFIKMRSKRNPDLIGFLFLFKATSYEL